MLSGFEQGNSGSEESQESGTEAKFKTKWAGSGSPRVEISINRGKLTWKVS